MSIVSESSRPELGQTPENRSSVEPSIRSELAALADGELLDAWVRDRHPPALAALVERYSAMVLSVCRRRCRSEADAEDAFQTTFLYLARNSKKIRQPERLAGWLHRVAQRAATATLKLPRRESHAMVEPPAKPDDPLDRLTQRHEAIVLDEELADLPEHYRSAIVMHLYEGHPIQSLAEHFGTTVGSIRGRLQRGKQLLAQRLRRRGVVPIVAWASASVWTVSASQAAPAGQAFIDSTSSGDLPDPPIETSLLESLLSQGVRLMPSIYTAAGLIGGSAFIALLMMNDGTQGQTTSQRKEITFPSSGAPVVTQFALAQTNTAETAGEEKKNRNEQGGDPNQASGGANNTGSMVGGGDLRGAGAPDNLIWQSTAVVPPATSSIATNVNNALGKNVELDIATTLDKLPQLLSQAAAIPVLIDDRGLAFAELDDDKERVEFAVQDMPLQSSLRQILRPLGLRAVVEDEGLVITAAPSVLVHKGIGTARWINVDEEAEKRISETLDERTTIEFIDAPMVDVLDTIALNQNIAIYLDRRAIEEVGLSGEEPVTISIGGVKLRSVLQLLLQDLDLTYTVQGESLVVTTLEAADSKMLNRIYWLEGTGFAAGDYASIMETIQTTVSPDSWSIVGGSSNMNPLNSIRPALMISTTYSIHEHIEKFFTTMRETHFGRDPILESKQVPMTGMHGRGTGAVGGMGGGGGGGGFF